MTATHTPEYTVDGWISTLLSVPEGDRGLRWLRDALRVAVRVEFATVPPYLCAFWSIKDPQAPQSAVAARVLREIALEEMTHLGTVANLLVAVGGKVDVLGAPTNYPGPLPGNIIPDLTIQLQGLTRDLVGGTFMRIEQPETPLYSSSYHTIGQFYDEVIKMMRDLTTVPYTGTGQVFVDMGGGGFVQPITSRDDALAALSMIKEEGEGTGTDPGQDTVMAHYYRFRELYEGKALTRVDGQWRHDGPPVPFPTWGEDVYPVLPVPPGGWQEADVSEEAWAKITAFRRTYGDMLRNLHGAWNGRGATAMGKAVAKMGALKVSAQELMNIEIPGRQGNYGPDFRVG